MKLILLILSTAIFIATNPIPQLLENDPNENHNMDFSIPENEVKKFSLDPITYIKEHFNMVEYISKNPGKKAENYHVYFRSPKGYVMVTYDRSGNMKKTYQNFQDVNLPREIMKEIYQSHKGWVVTEVKYTASGNRDYVNKKRYKIRLKKGNSVEKLIKTERFEEVDALELVE